MIHLILGGARSGKSSYAEKLAKELSSEVLYVATATADDDEMEKRISHHKNSRPANWALEEEPFYLSTVIDQCKENKDTILIDCLTLWLSNWLCKKEGTERLDWVKECESFIKILKQTKCNVFVVSNEVGSGIVPLGELSREFADRAGWLNQSIASIADKVTMVIAGLPLELKK